VIELWDTSALILAARDHRAGALLADALAADEVALCEPILIEYLNGARNAAEYDRYETALRAARVVATEAEDWHQALYVHRELARRAAGLQRSVRLPDLIIAAVAAREAMPIVHCDADYDRVAAITGQASRWIVPRGSA